MFGLCEYIGALSDNPTIHNLPPALVGTSPVGVSPTQPRRGGAKEILCGVYCFIHRLTGKCYIGSSKDIGARIVTHIKEARNGSTAYFHKQLRELGISEFDCEVLEICLPEDRLKRERHFIIFYNSVFPNGFNLYSDPTNGWDYYFSDGIRRKISEFRKGRRMSDATRAKISAAISGKNHPLYGTHRSAESKAKASKSLKGHLVSLESRTKMSQSYNRVFTADTRAKISESGKGRKPFLGKKHTDATRLKMVQGQIRQHAEKRSRLIQSTNPA